MSHAISEAHKNIILKILKAHLPQAKIIAFGSRIRGGAKAYSDLDLCLDNGQPIPLAKISQLEESLPPQTFLTKSTLSTSTGWTITSKNIFCLMGFNGETAEKKQRPAENQFAGNGISFCGF